MSINGNYEYQPLLPRTSDQPRAFRYVDWCCWCCFARKSERHESDLAASVPQRQPSSTTTRPSVPGEDGGALSATRQDSKQYDSREVQTEDDVWRLHNDQQSRRLLLSMVAKTRQLRSVLGPGNYLNGVVDSTMVHSEEHAQSATVLKMISGNCI